MNPDCIFCNIASGKSPATLEFEDDDVVAFRDIDPKAQVHILINLTFTITAVLKYFQANNIKHRNLKAFLCRII